MSPNPTTPTPSSPTRRAPSTRRSSPAHAGSTAHISASDSPIRTGSRSADNISRSKSNTFHDTAPHAIDDRIRHYLEDQARLVHQMQRTNTVDSTASHRSPGSSKAAFMEAMSRVGSGLASPPTQTTKHGQNGVLGTMEGASVPHAGGQGVSWSTHEGPLATTVFASKGESMSSADHSHERLSQTVGISERDHASMLLDSSCSPANAQGAVNMLSCPFILGIPKSASSNLHPATSGVSGSLSFATTTAPSGMPNSPPARPKHKHARGEDSVKRINKVIEYVSESLEQLTGSSPNLEQAARKTMMVVTSPTVASLPRAGGAKENGGGEVVGEQFQLGTVQRQQLLADPGSSGGGGGHTLQIPPPAPSSGEPIVSPLNGKPGASVSTLDRRSRGRLQTHPPNGVLEHQHASVSWNTRVAVWLLCVAAVMGTSAWASWNAASIADRYPVMSMPMVL